MTLGPLQWQQYVWPIHHFTFRPLLQNSKSIKLWIVQKNTKLISNIMLDNNSQKDNLCMISKYFKFYLSWNLSHAQFTIKISQVLFC